MVDLIADSAVVKESVESPGNAGEESILPKKKKYTLKRNVAYQKLFDSVVRETSGIEDNVDSASHSSQFGFTVWSPDENDMLFTQLSRKGQDDIRIIAEAIGTKSEPEVKAYLQLLRQETLTRRNYDPHFQRVDFVDAPAALEIGEKCITTLEKVANALLSDEQELEEKKGRERHGEFWLLDESSAKVINESMKEGGLLESSNIEPNLRSALQLFDLDNLLDLSSRLFMNPRTKKKNWRCYVDEGQTPSLYATAFLEFQDLVVDLTKRLITSAIYFALSRLRISKTKSYEHKRQVRREDVVAAIRVLDAKTDTNEFWIGVARRCELDVYERVGIKKCRGRYSYEEVERILSEPGSRAPSDASLTSAERSLSAERRLSDLDPDNIASDVDVLPDPSTTQDVSGSDMSLDIEDPLSSGSYDTLQDTEAEAIDHYASQQETQRLARLLKRQKRKVQHAEDQTPPKRSRIRKSFDEEDVDWRDFIDYKRPWQRYDIPTPIGSLKIAPKSHKQRSSNSVSNRAGDVPDFDGETEADGNAEADGDAEIDDDSLSEEMEPSSD